jgi:MtN3 and saliva related transmembrane protein
MNYVGYVAAFLTTFSFLPQALQVIRTKDTKGINLTMYSMFVVGVICWTLYGISLGDYAIIAANAVTGMFASVVLAYKLRYR